LWLLYFEAESMSEPDVLDHTIQTLKEAQRIGWQQLAEPFLTPFVSRELRSDIKRTNDELRYYPEMRSELLRSRAQPVEDAAGGSGEFDFRIFTN
jgi:hypothetical protein